MAEITDFEYKKRIVKIGLLGVGTFSIVQFYNSTGLGRMVNGLLNVELFSGGKYVYRSRRRRETEEFVPVKPIGSGIVSLWEADDDDGDWQFDLDQPGLYNSWDDELIDQGWENDELTRVRVNSDIYEIHLYDHGFNNGRHAVVWFQDGIVNLKKSGDYDLNDKVSTFRIKSKSPVRLRLWENDDKDGKHQALTEYGDYVAGRLFNMNNLGGWENDALTLVHLDGAGEAILYSDDNFTGHATLIKQNSGLINLKDRRRGSEWPNDKVTSIRVLPPGTINAFVVLYDNDPVGGWSAVLERKGTWTKSNLEQKGFRNDQTTWVMIERAPQGVHFYEDDNRRGKHKWLPEGYHNLKKLNWDQGGNMNDKVSSLYIV